MTNKPLELKSLNSSNLSGVHYDDETNTLTVEFKSGGRYAYGGVPREHYDGLLGAESHGSYFHKHIRRNQDYKWRKHGSDS